MMAGKREKAARGTMPPLGVPCRKSLSDFFYFIGYHRLCPAAVCPAFATVKRRRDPRRERETVRPYWKDCQEKKNTAGSRSSLGRRHGSPQTAGLIRKRRLEGLIAARLLSGFPRVPSCPEGSLYGGLTAPIGLSSGFLRSAKPNHTRFLLPRSIRISGGSG